MTSNATFYDHAKNHAYVAQAIAVAKARKTAIEDGTSYTVRFTTSSGRAMWWNGCFYDALKLAKSLFASQNEVQLLRDSDGKAIGIASATF